MPPAPEAIQQHGTHTELVEHAGPWAARFPGQDLDAIVVPAARPAAHVDHAVTLARAVGCWLLVLCSHRAHATEVEDLLAERSFERAIVVDLPDGYRHELLEFPSLLSLRDELPQACSSFTTNLSIKRNIGLVMARMLRWRRIFFLDDDIRDITDPDLQTTVAMLKDFPAVGMRVIDFPDNSIVCHANRQTGGDQDVFVSGAALAVDTAADINFFPDIYNEDWFFFYDAAAGGLLGSSGRKATQLRYSPFADPERAAWQEFGDVLAEGLYGALHQSIRVEGATRDYWSYFLEARRSFLEGIITRSHRARPDVQSQLLLSAQRALKCSGTISPELCDHYVRMWRCDLAAWKIRVAGISERPSPEAALRELGLTLSWGSSSARRIQYHRYEMPEDLPAGPVGIPRSPALRVATTTVEERKTTVPFPELPSDSHGWHGRLRKRVSIRPLRIGSARWNTGTPAHEHGPLETGHSADTRPETTTACS